MRTTIEFDPSFTMLTAELSAGEAIKAEPRSDGRSAGVGDADGHGWRRRSVRGLQTDAGRRIVLPQHVHGGPSGGWVSLAPPTPGDIISHDLLPGQNLFIQGSSFLACTENVQTDAKFQGMKGMFSGEKIFFLRAYTEGGQGTVHVNSYGAIKKLSIQPGSELVVDTGHVVAFTDSVQYSVGKVGGLGSLIAGGEGLVLKFTGSGDIWDTDAYALLADGQARAVPAVDQELTHDRPRPLRTEPDRRPARRKHQVGAVQLAVRPSHGRHVHRAYRGHRPRADGRGFGRDDPRCAPVARPRLGRGAGLGDGVWALRAVRAARPVRRARGAAAGGGEGVPLLLHA